MKRDGLVSEFHIGIAQEQRTRSMPLVSCEAIPKRILREPSSSSSVLLGSSLLFPLDIILLAQIKIGAGRKRTGEGENREAENI